MEVYTKGAYLTQRQLTKGDLVELVPRAVNHRQPLGSDEISVFW